MEKAVKLAALAAIATFGLAAQAQAVTLTHNSSIAGSGEVGSVDYFRFSTSASDLVRMETFTGNFDSVMYLFRDTGTLSAGDFIAADDDSGSSNGSPLGFRNSMIEMALDTGDYITAVSDFSFSLSEAISGINDSSSFGAGFGNYQLVVSGLSVIDPSVVPDNGSGDGDGNGSGGGTGGGTPPTSNVSEPVTLGLFGLALAGFGAIRRKRS